MWQVNRTALTLALSVVVPVAYSIAADMPAKSAAPGQGRGAAIREACGAEIKSYCDGVEAGGGRIAQCLRGNADKLSQGCRDGLGAARDQTDAKKTQ